MFDKDEGRFSNREEDRPLYDDEFIPTLGLTPNYFGNDERKPADEVQPPGRPRIPLILPGQHEPIMQLWVEAQAEDREPFTYEYLKVMMFGANQAVPEASVIDISSTVEFLDMSTDRRNEILKAILRTSDSKRELADHFGIDPETVENLFWHFYSKAKALRDTGQLDKRDYADFSGGKWTIFCAKLNRLSPVAIREEYPQLTRQNINTTLSRLEILLKD
ncbi:MAG: hypothetical protein KAV42_01185 [Candidatus Krumholzibacteria bacterium]|nr:hypothetical protein [Candidatus Krumholzibacteria bacterium]